MIRSSFNGPEQAKKGLLGLAKNNHELLQHEHHELRRELDFWSLMKQLHPNKVLKSAIDFCEEVPTFLWTFFIESFLIAKYRPEWSYYCTWKANEGDDSEGELESSRRALARSIKRKKNFKLTSAIPKDVRHNHSMCHLITINVSGKVYQTQLRTLALFPDTLLGDPKRRAQFYDPVHEDYFIDRSRLCFDAILYYYQSRGILRRPHNVNVDMMEEEIRFFDLGQDVIDKLRREEGIVKDIEKPVPRRLLQRKYWLLFEHPESSIQARIVAILSIMVVLISVFLFCAETMADFQRTEDDLDELLEEDAIDKYDPLFTTESACMCWFVFEFVIRAINAPRKGEFAKSMSNIIDLIAIIPYFVSIFILSQHKSDSNKNVNKTTSLTILRVIRLFRVFRILKLSRHNRGLKVPGKTLQASMSELGLLMFFMVIGVVLFSSAVYFAELTHPESHFPSIIDAFWWSVTTMTTCGYGDDVPHTVVGKLVGAVCAISGVLTLALPVPVIVSNFNNFYTREDDSIVANVESDHITQCPCRYSKYDSGGGNDIPDYSDSDFEQLKEINKQKV